MPAEACDCHAHVIGPQHLYPFVAERSYTPPDALLADYLHVLRTLGFQRAVLVQPSMHGTDHRAMLDAIAALGPGDPQMRAIASINANCTEEEIRYLHDHGVRGVRANLIYRGAGVEAEDIPRIARRIKPYGWNLEVLLDVSQHGPDLLDLDSLGVPLIVDHLGHMDAGRGVNDAGFLALLEMVKRGNTWVKLSGAYRLLNKPPFPNGDITLSRARVDRSGGKSDALGYGLATHHVRGPYAQRRRPA
jgi:predicted TIM-barrel fold metal-dependent hydrolase